MGIVSLLSSIVQNQENVVEKGKSLAYGFYLSIICSCSV